MLLLQQGRDRAANSVMAGDGDVGTVLGTLNGEGREAQEATLTSSIPIRDSPRSSHPSLPTGPCQDSCE